MRDLQSEFRDTNLGFRILFALYALGGAVGGLYGGFYLLHETKHWIPWAIALVVVEPIGVACALALIVMISPDSFVAEFLAGAVRRATFGALVVGIVFFAFVVGTLAWVAWYFIADMLR